MTSKKREIAIFNNKKEQFDAAKKLAKSLVETKAFSEVTLFTRDAGAIPASEEFGTKVIPDTCDTISKARNFINAEYKLKQFDGFLHVVEDIVELQKDPTEFLAALEKMMDVLDYDVWFNTICDPCNYVYSKFNPRLSVEMDKEDVKSLGLSSKLLFTSHSNTAWICYNFASVPSDLLAFNESFDIPMFMIIEFLARRRNTKRSGQQYLMNMYATIPEELGVFKVSAPSAGEDPKSEKMAEEDKAFRSLNVNFAPDNDIDKILESFWTKIKSKLEEEKQAC